MEGKVLGQYRVIERMGGGGMGAVFRAFDDTLEREVALKIVAADIDDPDKRFRAEAVAIARLCHPGIAAVYELFQHDGQWVMVMELVHGETLEHILDRIGTFAPKRAAELCMQVLTALTHAHKMGVVHRDLKPSNIMIGENGVKLMDFGIARVEGTERLTNDGFMMGTPAYMAPEQVIGREIDGRADLYALGIVFYRLLTNKLPFKGDTPYDMAQSQVRDQPIPIDLFRPDLPVWVKYIIDRALAKAPDERYQSAEEFRSAFGRALVEATSGATRRLLQTEQMVRPTTAELARPAAVAAPQKSASGKSDRPAVSATAARRAARKRQVTAWTVLATAASAATLVVVTKLQWPADSVTGVVATAAPQSAAAEPAPRLGAPAPPVAGADAKAPRPAARREKAATSPTPPPAAAMTTVAVFSLKLLVLEGPRISERDVVLTLTNRQFSIGPTNGGAPLWTVPYARVGRATYVKAREPRWDPELSAPIDKMDLGGGTRHWLVVQTPDAHAILRLDSGGWQRVLDAFEVASGRKIDRPVTDK